MSVIAFISVSAQCGSVNWYINGNTLTRTIEGFTGNALSTTARNNVEVYLLFTENLQAATDAYGTGTFSSFVLASDTTINNGGAMLDGGRESSNSAMVDGLRRDFAVIAFITIDASNAASMFGTGGGGTAGLIPSDDWSKYYGTYYTWISGNPGNQVLIQSPPDTVMSIAFANAHNTTGTWVMIPEPATAGLALAGLALLFRRKRK